MPENNKRASGISWGASGLTQKTKTVALEILVDFASASPRIALGRHVRRAFRRAAAGLEGCLTHEQRGLISEMAFMTICHWRQLGVLAGRGSSPLSEPPLPPDVLARMTALPRLDISPAEVKTAAELAIAASFPDAIAEEIWSEASEPLKAAQAMNLRGPMTLRLRGGITTLESFRTHLAVHDINAEIVGRGRLAPHAIHVERGMNVYGHPEPLRRMYEVQDEGSQLIVEQMELKPGMAVLDYCAGRGGKTIAIGDVISSPVSVHDVDELLLEHNAQRARKANMKTVRLAKGASFDAVLADAPCSAWGTIRRGPDLKWRVDENQLATFPALQLEILMEAQRYVRPGGSLTYATCTFRRAENDDVIAAFLERCPRFVPRTLRVPSAVQNEYGMTLWPHLSNTDGFYVSVMDDVSATCVVDGAHE